MNSRIPLLISGLLITLLLSGCSLFGGEPEAPPTPDMTPTPVIIDLPTPTPLPVEPPPGQGVVSLLGDPAAEESLLSGPDGVDPQSQATQVVQLPRFSAGAYSFVPPAGWEIDELDGPNTVLVRRAGEDPFTGALNSVPFIYMRLMPAVAEVSLRQQLDANILANLGGTQTTEPPQGIIIDGVKGAWQFAEGQNDTTPFRAYLMVIPAGDQALQVVVWGPRDTWGVVAPEMAKVLETMRFPGS